MTIELLLPDLGEGITSGTVITVSVETGTAVTTGQTLFEIETDKVTVEIPSNSNGVIGQLFARPGDEVAVGNRLAIIESIAGTESENLTEAAPGIPATTKPTPVTDNAYPQAATPTVTRARHTGSHHPAPAGPAARRMARELGINIRNVPGSGQRGRISKQDVIHFAKQQLQTPTGIEQNRAPSPLPDLSRFGELESIPLTNIQRATARNMARAWQEIPHAWMQEQIDITDLERQRQRLKSEQDAKAAPLTITPFVIKAMAIAMEQFPLFNATIDMANDQILYRHFIDIGVAVDTPPGLVVPIIRGVDRLNPQAIAEALSELSARAQQNGLKPDELRGGGITLTNLGNMGLSSISPIINWPQSSIVGIASARWSQQRDREGNWQEHLLLPVSLAFDHRIINGADGARFISCLKTLLEESEGPLI